MSKHLQALWSNGLLSERSLCLFSTAMFNSCNHYVACSPVRIIYISLHTSIVQTFVSTMAQCSPVRIIYLRWCTIDCGSSLYFSSVQHCPNICKHHGARFFCQDDLYFSSFKHCPNICKHYGARFSCQEDLFFSLHSSIVQTFASTMEQGSPVRVIYVSFHSSIAQTFASTMEQCSLVRTISLFTRKSRSTITRHQEDKIKQSIQLSLPHQDDCNTRMDIK